MKRSGVTERITQIDNDLVSKEQRRRETGQDRKRLGDPGKAPEEVKHPDPIEEIKAEREKTRKYQKEYANAQSTAQEMIRRALVSCYTFEELEELVHLIKTEVEEGKEKLLLEYKEYTEKGESGMRLLIESLDKQIADWYETEEKAKAYDAYVERKAQCDDLDKQYSTLTEEIETLRAERKQVLSDMNLGINGLEIGQDNFLYHNNILRGITKSNKTGNWSTAESVQVFFGLGARFSGRVKVLVVDNAESLDAKTTGTITKWAEKTGFLVILLRVAEVPDPLEEGIIYIREGEVVTK
jgi:hypothetical protein